jgi:hypoxanthine phosphoribosyltransferase
MSGEVLADRVSRVLFNAEAIDRRTNEIAARIVEDYQHSDAAKDENGRPLLLVCILRGALIFAADLARRLTMPVEYDLISVSSYGNGTAPGAVRLTKDLEVPIGGRDVLIVEDIVDTGHTLDYLRRSLDARRPASIRVCTLIDKVSRRQVPVEVHYAGFALEEDAFIVGYGMDYAELYRNLPFIGVLKPEYVR